MLLKKDTMKVAGRNLLVFIIGFLAVCLVAILLLTKVNITPVGTITVEQATAATSSRPGEVTYVGREMVNF